MVGSSSGDDAHLPTAHGGDQWWWLRWDGQPSKVIELIQIDPCDAELPQGEYADECFIPEGHPGPHNFQPAVAGRASLSLISVGLDERLRRYRARLSPRFLQATGSPTCAGIPSRRHRPAGPRPPVQVEHPTSDHLDQASAVWLPLGARWIPALPGHPGAARVQGRDSRGRRRPLPGAGSEILPPQA